MNDSGFITTNIDVYDAEKEPWKIYSRGVPCGAADDSLYRCFITKKSSNLGNLKLQDEGKPVHRDSSSSIVVIGSKKKMCYMFDDDRRDYVLCAIKKTFIETCSSEMANVSVEFGAIQVYLYSLLSPYPINKSTFALLLDFPDHICRPWNHVVPQCLIPCLPYVVCVAQFNVKPLQDPFQA
ncbi:hypothetical protein BC332_28697 [Capsicum chinense]|nr:hypothetical protein BC332_28697 [Capsicum chinense]